MSSEHKAAVLLKAGREKSVLQGHPWLFSGAIAAIEGSPAAGDLLEVLDSHRKRIACAFYNPHSQISLRIWSDGSRPASFGAIFRSRLNSALKCRRALLSNRNCNAFRLLNSEGDFVPGLIIDNFNGHLVVQPLAHWVETNFEEIKNTLLEGLSGIFEVRSIRLRVEDDVVRHERITLESGVVYGEALKEVEIVENGIHYSVDLEAGQKTGFFFDQRQNRALLGELSSGRSLLDLFCYQGGFSLNALKCGASSVLSVDSSQPALDRYSNSLEANGLNDGRAEILCANIKEFLPQAVAEGRHFDVVVCDPPPFARRREHINSAASVYKDINRRAMQLMDDGELLTFTCSPFIDARLFRQIVFAAAYESGRKVRLISKPGPGLDHPVNISHMEGEYLSGLLLHVSR